MTNPFRKDSNDYAKFAATFSDDDLIEELTDDGQWSEGKSTEMVKSFRAGTADNKTVYAVKCALGSLANKNDLH